MTDTLNTDFTITATPTTGVGAAACTIAESDVRRMSRWVRGAYTLSTDSPVNVDLSGLSEAHYLTVRSSAKVRVRITSADGNNQAIPVNPFAIIVCSGEPITAIDLTREAGVETTVEVFFAQEP